MRVILVVFFALFVFALIGFIYSNRLRIVSVFNRNDDGAENIVDVPSITPSPVPTPIVSPIPSPRALPIYSPSPIPVQPTSTPSSISTLPATGFSDIAILGFMFGVLTTGIVFVRKTQ